MACSRASASLAVRSRSFHAAAAAASVSSSSRPRIGLRAVADEEARARRVGRSLPRGWAVLYPVWTRAATAARALHVSSASKAKGKEKAVDNDPTSFHELENRSFSIIAHIDHGKSSLADRLLEQTGTIAPGGAQQFLDKLKVERERGITVKSQAVSMVYEREIDGRRYLLNLIDTPGHVDFAYEVSRSLAACQGALLLVDATQGIQAQTLSVFNVAKQRGLTIIPVINKIDLPAADTEGVSHQIATVLGLDVSGALHVSAKTGEGVGAVLDAIIERVPVLDGSEAGAGTAAAATATAATTPPQPTEWAGKDLRALVFDAWFDQYKGVIALLAIKDGSIRKGDKIASAHTRKRYEVIDVGINNPEPVSMPVLRKGQVGWVICNMKDVKEAHIGDTWHMAGETVRALDGFKEAAPMVFAGVFPVEQTDFVKLEEAISKLTINDRSVSVSRASSAALGQGCRLGFLGTLHMDVFRQRLEDEYGARIIVTAPTVPYKVVYRDGRTRLVTNPVEFPEGQERAAKVKEVQEPMVVARIVVPNEYTGEMMELCAEHRGEPVSYDFVDAQRVTMAYRMPLTEIVTDFFDKLKSRSSGFASFEYEESGYVPSDLVRMNILVAQQPVDALAMILHRSETVSEGRKWTKKMREVIPRQLFDVAIQAAVDGKVVARESMSAVKKDVTAGLYGGHYERKLKQLNKQKEGKRRLKRLGKVEIEASAFLRVLDTRAGGGKK